MGGGMLVVPLARTGRQRSARPAAVRLPAARVAARAVVPRQGQQAGGALPAINAGTAALPRRLLACLAARDVARLQLAREILLAEMEQPPSTSTGQRAGLNTRKLTQGFRQLLAPAYSACCRSTGCKPQALAERAGSARFHRRLAGGLYAGALLVAFRKRFGVMPATSKSVSHAIERVSPAKAFTG
ncbi:hypothetical protein M8494_25335 [Serratia ureilytica]